MADLKKNPTLKDLQAHIKKLCEEKGWHHDNPETKFLLFVEEVGELAKAMRKKPGLWGEKAKKRKKSFELEEEFADVLNSPLALANHYGVALEAAYRIAF